MPVHNAIELLPLLDNREEDCYRHRTVRRDGHHRTGAIRINAIAAARGCPISSLLLAANDGVLDPGERAFAIEGHHAR